MQNLPFPAAESDEAQHCQRVTDAIATAITHAGGKITFADFMSQALYAPGLGYYSAGLRKFGAGGDFVTAPEISPLFSQCLAIQCQQVLNQLDEQRVILEFGAGTGIMAAHILQCLQAWDCLPKNYYILEVSADLQQRQYDTIKAHVPDYIDKVEWLSKMPEQPISGVVLANEVLDAMPVHRFRLDAQDVSEFYVSYEDNAFQWQCVPTESERLITQVERLRPQLDTGYISEINLSIKPWITSLASSIEQGLVLLIDYGFPEHEYYHLQRNEGTLMCHYQHRSHDNPLILAGLQDITAHVDFSDVAHTAEDVGLHVAGYTNQANFLFSCGITDLLNQYDPSDTASYLKVAQQSKVLLLPSEMGELFKVIGLTKKIDMNLCGFEKDERHKL